VTVNDNQFPSVDTNGLSDHIVFDGQVGDFFVSVTGDVFFPPNTTAPVQMNLLNFLITSQRAGNFRATLSRIDLDAPVIGPVVGIAEYSATFDPGTAGQVSFQSYIDPANSGAAGSGRKVFDPVVTTPTSTGPTTVMSLPVDLTGDFSMVSTLDFTFTSGGSMTAQTDLQVESATVPEPTTLLLLGPGMVGLAALRRRMRSKA
jgi:hypothetical protein